jgi:hypothetical protein
MAARPDLVPAVFCIFDGVLSFPPRLQFSFVWLDGTIPGLLNPLGVDLLIEPGHAATAPGPRILKSVSVPESHPKLGFK